MKVLVIPENRELDQYILKPVVERMFADLNRKARIYVLPDRVSGVTEALDRKFIEQIVLTNPMIDLFLLVVDRDCEEKRETGPLAARVAEAGALGKTLIGCLAIEELEVWALALFKDELGVSWSAVRAECHPKETYFEPLINNKGWETGVGRGRKEAMRTLAGNWKSIKSLCDEIAKLQTGIAAWLESQR
jgi:hypothetical protein